MTLAPFEASALARAGVRHGFFGRRGGVSRGVYASLNAGPGSRDDPEAVRTNRARIAAALGVSPDRLLSLHQVHSARAVRVDGPWRGVRPQADALVTTTPGLALTALAADCAPILFADPESGVIAAAHAGWRGALAGVIEAAIAEMEAAGAARARIQAAIGPCIGAESYEVGPEFRDRFVSDDAANAQFFTPGARDRLHFDLKAYCAARLERACIAGADVLIHDTCELEDDFFSNRRAVKRGEGDYGRNLSAIALA
jgi:YfiH family protein